MKKIRKVVIYPKTITMHDTSANYRKVAVYARVSTSSAEQLNSVEAQKDYYTKMVKSRPDWEFFRLYSDEGLSGTSHKRRDGFNNMLEDAEAHKFNLIITKSISRFARNTVDTLICIRRLKELGVEVYFQKEDLWTFDSKGEFMLTLLSSMAQDESRSISENVTWGHRKRFADGKYSLAYSRFLGYDKGNNGGLIINTEQAEIVRLIYKLYLEGKSIIAIVHYLDNKGIPTPTGKQKWNQTTVLSILSNEKYKGDALLQKKFTVDFLTKKQKANEGELPKYYVTDGHEAIIPRATFDFVQEEIQRRCTEFGKHFSCTHMLATKIICEDCGGFFGLKSAHSGSWQNWYWFCNNRYNRKPNCSSPRIREDKMMQLCQGAIINMIKKESLFEETMKYLSPCIRSTKELGTKKKRLLSISEHLEKLKLDSELNIYLVDEVISTIIYKIIPKANGSIEFVLIDGSKSELLII